MSAWHATVLTLFPEFVPGPLAASITGRALEEGVWRLDTVALRDFALDRHGSVDDTPFGGGAGMVMRADVIARALDSLPADDPRPRLCLSARGRPLTQERVRSWADGPGVIVLCGRFEGIDQRVIEARDLEEVSLGDFVLSGGEPAMFCLLDACVRLLPGVLGNRASLDEESFAGHLLEYPQFTRPRDFEGQEVPSVLLTGHHEAIRQWRLDQARETTRTRRPDLWAAHQSSMGGERPHQTTPLAPKRRRNQADEVRP